MDHGQESSMNFTGSSQEDLLPYKISPSLTLSMMCGTRRQCLYNFSISRILHLFSQKIEWLYKLDGWLGSAIIIISKCDSLRQNCIECTRNIRKLINHDLSRSRLFKINIGFCRISCTFIPRLRFQRLMNQSLEAVTSMGHWRKY